jgi:uncharacterized membrane protein (Fun14 family)
MSSLGIEAILFSFGGSSLLGFAAGYALRRIIKIAAVIIGVFVLGLAYLSYKGWVNVQWPVVENQTQQMVYNASAQVLHMINDTASKFASATTTSHGLLIGESGVTPIAAGAGFIAGFTLGLKK